jgi:hypothetical protein
LTRQQKEAEKDLKAEGQVLVTMESKSEMFVAARAVLAHNAKLAQNIKALQFQLEVLPGLLEERSARQEEQRQQVQQYLLQALRQYKKATDAQQKRAKAEFDDVLRPS